MKCIYFTIRDIERGVLGYLMFFLMIIIFFICIIVYVFSVKYIAEPKSL